MFKTIKALLLLVSSVLLLVEIYPVDGKEVANQRHSDAEKVERWGKMFDDGQRAAKDSLYEMNVLKHLIQNYNVPNNTISIDRNGQAQSDLSKMILNFDNEGGVDKQYLISGPKVKELSSKNIPYSDTSEIVVEEIKNQQEPVASSSNSQARQSGLFSGLNSFMASNPMQQSGFGLNGLSNANPLLQGVGNLLQSAQKFPSLTPATPSKPPAPVKSSSLIGNNGGSTALTNDNVVVVNVLSYN